MNCKKIGGFIKQLRLEKNYTQKILADKLMLSDKTISKWERGLGCPDISLLTELAYVLNVNVERILYGEIEENDYRGVNMKNTKIYVCKKCGNISFCTGNANVTCCGRNLEALTAKKADESQKLKIEAVENDWYITSDCQMTKDDFISFAAFLTGDKIKVFKQYPEWNFNVRLEKREHGKFIWYSTKDGLMYQLI